MDGDRPQLVGQGAPARAGSSLVGVAAPPVGVALPVYNGEPYLERSLNSLRAQEGVDFELVIADNCSDDGTEEICRQAQREDARIRYVRRDRNVGAMNNHNMLVSEVSAPYLMWSSSDDEYHPTRLQRLWSELDSDPSAVLAFSSAIQVDESGARVGRWSTDAPVHVDDAVTRFRGLFEIERTDGLIYGLIRRDTLLRTGLQPPIIQGDRVLVAELSLHGRFVNVTDELMSHRIHSGQLSERIASRQFREQEDGARPTYFPPNIEEGLLYLEVLRRVPLSAVDRRRAYRAMRPWLARNAMPIGRNLARLPVDLVRHLSGRPL